MRTVSTSCGAKLCVTDCLRRDIHPDNDQQIDNVTSDKVTSNLPVSQWCSCCCIIDTTPACYPLVITTTPALPTALRYTASRSDSLLATMPEQQQGPVRLGVKMHPPTILVEYYVKDPTQYSPQPQASKNQEKDKFSRNTSASKLRRKTVRLHNLNCSKVRTYVRTSVYSCIALSCGCACVPELHIRGRERGRERRTSCCRAAVG